MVKSKSLLGIVLRVDDGCADIGHFNNRLRIDSLLATVEWSDSHGDLNLSSVAVMASKPLRFAYDRSLLTLTLSPMALSWVIFVLIKRNQP